MRLQFETTHLSGSIPTSFWVYLPSRKYTRLPVIVWEGEFTGSNLLEAEQQVHWPGHYVKEWISFFKLYILNGENRRKISPAEARKDLHAFGKLARKVQSGELCTTAELPTALLEAMRSFGSHLVTSPSGLGCVQWQSSWWGMPDLNIITSTFHLFQLVFVC